MNLYSEACAIKERIESEMENDDIFHKGEFEEYVGQLLNHGLLSHDPAMEGIGKLIVDQGVSTLTDKQLIYFICVGLLESDNYVSECSRCTEPIPWCEMIYAVVEGDEYCGYCRHMYEKWLHE